MRAQLLQFNLLIYLLNFKNTFDFIVLNPIFDSGAVCQNTDGGYECMCPSGMEGAGITGSPCEESLVCGQNEEASNCANKEK